MTRLRTGDGLKLLLRDDLVEAAAWRNFVDSRSGEARLDLFDRYLPDARAIARQEWHRTRCANFDPGDAEQLAHEALLTAIDRFDPSRGVPFMAFARLRIRGAIRNELSKSSESAAIASYRRRAEKDRLASIREAASQDDDPLSALRDLAVGIAIGLLLEPNAIAELEKVPDADPSAYDELAWHQLVTELHGKIDLLPERERQILDYHYRQGVKFQEIARLMGLTKGRISQLHAQALKRLQRALLKYG